MQNSNKNQRPKRWLTALLVVPAALLYWATNVLWGCPVRALTGYPCPACGLTRATLAFVKGEFGLAFRHHPLFPLAWALLALALVYLILSTKNKLTKKGELIAAIIFGAAGILFVIVYIIRMATGTLV